MNSFDLIVIGAGPGGYPAAIRAAQRGARTLLVEKDSLGGTCLNCGCIPTKTLIAGAGLYRKITKADTLGIKVEGASVNYPAMISRKDEVIQSLQSGIQTLLKANHITTQFGTAAFRDAHTLVITDADNTMHTVSADKIIIATGSEAIMPSFIPQHDNIVDSRAFLTRTELPKHLLVLGGGYIGCEMACLAAALGSKVTIVELLDDILLLLDRDVRSEIKRSMKKDLGITILTGNPLQDIAVSPSGDIHAAVCEQKLTADMLLVAAGRRPVTDGLNLSAAGITPASSGCIPVDEFGQTAVPGIYAIGDVNGIMQLAHAATSQGLTAADHACGAETPPFNNIIPGVIFTMPEAAIVGKSQQDFASRKEFRSAKFFYRALGKAQAAGISSGFAKWITPTDSTQLIGAQVVGELATELIAEATLAISTGCTAEQIAHTIHGHPSLSEIWQEAAHALLNLPIHSSPK